MRHYARIMNLKSKNHLPLVCPLLNPYFLRMFFVYSSYAIERENIRRTYGESTVLAGMRKGENTGKWSEKQGMRFPLKAFRPPSENSKISYTHKESAAY